MRMSQLFPLLFFTFALPAPYAAYAAPGAVPNGQCADCTQGGVRVSIPGLPPLEALEHTAEPACAKSSVLTELLNNKGACARQAACNLVRSIPDAAGGLYSILGGNYMRDAKKTTERSCLDARGGSCAGEIWLTIYRDVAGTAKFVGNTVSKVASWGGKKISDWLDHPEIQLKQLQHKTANAAHFVRRLDRKKMGAYTSSAVSWPLNFATSLVSSMAAFYADTYGCARWEGAPHYSKCLQRNPTISCMSCNDFINASCGIIGGMAAEGKLLGFVASKGLGLWRDARLLAAVKRSEKTGLLLKAEAKIQAGARAAPKVTAKAAPKPAAPAAAASVEKAVEVTVPVSRAAGVAERTELLRKLDVSYLQPEEVVKATKAFPRSSRRLLRSLAEKDPAFAALPFEKQRELTAHVIHQVKSQKRLSFVALEAELEQLASGKLNVDPFLSGGVKGSANKAREIFYDKARPVTVRAIAEQRDKLRRWLQVKFNHPYPVIALDDATVDYAKTLAADAVGAPATAIDVGMVKADLAATIAKVESYQDDLARFVDETMTAAAQKEALQKALTSGKLRKGFKVDLELPEVTTVGKEARIGVRTQYFDSEVQLRIEINRLEKELRNRVGAKGLGLNDAARRAFEQAISIKRLETYRSELRRAMHSAPGKALAPEAQASLERISRLYKDWGATALREEFKPPTWAFDRLHWEQLHGEVKTIVWKEFPSRVEKFQQSKILEFRKSLSEDDLRAMGLQNMAAEAAYWKRTKWANVLKVVATAGAGGVTGWSTLGKPVFDFFIGDDSTKEGCAAKPTKKEFAACMDAYLQDKFHDKYKKALEGRKSFLDAEGRITDLDVLDEIDDGLRRFAEYHEDENRKRDLSDATQGTILGRAPPGVVDAEILFETAISAPTPEEFKSASLAYLKHEHPGLFDVRAAAIDKILSAPIDSDEQRMLIQDIAVRNYNLSYNLNTLVRSRSDRLYSGRGMYGSPGSYRRGYGGSAYPWEDTGPSSYGAAYRTTPGSTSLSPSVSSPGGTPVTPAGTISGPLPVGSYPAGDSSRIGSAGRPSAPPETGTIRSPRAVDPYDSERR